MSPKNRTLFLLWMKKSRIGKKMVELIVNEEQNMCRIFNRDQIQAMTRQNWLFPKNKSKLETPVEHKRSWKYHWLCWISKGLSLSLVCGSLISAFLFWWKCLCIMRVEKSYFKGWLIPELLKIFLCQCGRIHDWLERGLKPRKMSLEVLGEKNREDGKRCHIKQILTIAQLDFWSHTNMPV